MKIYLIILATWLFDSRTRWPSTSLPIYQLFLSFFGGWWIAPTPVRHSYIETHWPSGSFFFSAHSFSIQGKDKERFLWFDPSVESPNTLSTSFMINNRSYLLFFDINRRSQEIIAKYSQKGKGPFYKLIKKGALHSRVCENWLHKGMLNW